MKYYLHKSMAARLLQAEEAIEIGRNHQELNDLLVQQGYTEREFSIGAGYVATVRAIDVLKREQLGKQVNATADADSAYRTLRRHFAADRQVVRLALDGHPDYAGQLRLSERTHKDRDAFILQARHFYEGIRDHEEVRNILESAYGIMPGVMAARLDIVIGLEQALVVQQYMIGQMRDITKKRREAMKALDTWMNRFIAIARIVFKHDTPKLHKLGIRVKQRG